MAIAMLLALITLGTAPAAAAALRVNLVTFGPAPAGVVDVLKAGLAKELGAEVGEAGEIAVPVGAYGHERRQYRAEAFLPLLTPYRQGSRELALGVTNVDLYVPALNFVFGLADPGSKGAVISLARLDPKFYGLPEDQRLLGERTLKEAVHELGHLLGLGHCSQPSCIMFFSNSLTDTDRKGLGFCPACRQRLAGGK